MAIDFKLIYKLLADYKNPEDIILTKALRERAMKAELTEHLGYEKHDPAGQQRELAQRRDDQGPERRSRGHAAGNTALQAQPPN